MIISRNIGNFSQLFHLICYMLISFTFRCTHIALTIEGVLMLVWVPRMCRRFLKFAYDVMRVCMGKVYSLLVRGVSRSKTLNPFALARSGWMLY